MVLVFVQVQALVQVLSLLLSPKLQTQRLLGLAQVKGQWVKGTLESLELG